MIEMMYPRNSLHSVFLLGVIVKMLASQDMIMPKFKIMHVGSNYSVRCYTNTRWAETKSNSGGKKVIKNILDNSCQWHKYLYPFLYFQVDHFISNYCQN